MKNDLRNSLMNVEYLSKDELIILRKALRCVFLRKEMIMVDEILKESVDKRTKIYKIKKLEMKGRIEND